MDNEDRVRKLMQTFDEGPQTWLDTYQAPGIEGHLVTATLPRSEQQAHAVRRELLARGAVLPALAEARSELERAIAATAQSQWRAAHCGWRRDGKGFVSHRAVIRCPGFTDTIVPPVAASAGIAGPLAVCGSLAGWQALAKIAIHSTPAIVALCAAFAAPLLHLLHRPSFAIVLVGPSRAGKSTAQLLGASAIGFGTEEAMAHLDATPAGLLAAALAFSDHMLPINEVATARGQKSDAYVALRECTYSLLGGQDIIRHPSWAGSSGAPSTFRIVLLLSSEHSPDAWASRSGQTRDEGETARLIGLPAVAPGRQTIFDRPPSDLTSDALSDWETEQFSNIRNGLPDHRGVAFGGYMSYVVSDISAAQADAQQDLGTFESRVLAPSMSPVARDIVSKFGVLYAAGSLAIQAGVLPFDKRVLGGSLKRACLSAIAELPDPDAELRVDRKILGEKLSGGGIVDLHTASQRARSLIGQADGYKAPATHGHRYIIRAESVVGWFRSALRCRRVLEWLDDAGFLEHGRSRTAGRSLEWAQRQVTWPDGTRPRSISMFLPNGLQDLSVAP